MAHVSLTQTALSVETAEVAIRDLVRTREPKRVKIEDIQKLVATHYNVSRADILSSRRTANVVRPAPGRDVSVEGPDAAGACPRSGGGSAVATTRPCSTPCARSKV